MAAAKYKIYLPRFMADDNGKPDKVAPAGITSSVYDMICSKFGGLTRYEFCRGMWYDWSTGNTVDEMVEVIDVIVNEDSEQVCKDFMEICYFIKRVYNQKSVLITREEVNPIWI